MQTQQQKPIAIGFPPFLTRFTMFVLSPIAHIAIEIKNLASHLDAGTKYPVYASANPPAGKSATAVVIREAITK